MEERGRPPEVPSPAGGDGASALPYDAANARWIAELCEAVGAAVLVAGPDGTVARVYGPAALWLGARDEELLGAPLPETWPGVTVTRKAHGQETLLVLRPLEGHPDRALLLRQAAALRSFGALCHTINNPLTALVGRAQLLQTRKGLDPAVLKAAEVIQQSSARVAELIRELGLAIKEARRDLPEEPEAVPVAAGTGSRTPE